jgi:hypothetical protein
MRRMAKTIDPRQRGAATTEALILLPFFFIVWGGLFFSYKVHEKKVVVDEIARTCAWEQMSGGCTERRSPRCTFAGGPQLVNGDLEGSRASLENMEVRLGTFVIDFAAMFGPYFRPTFGTAREARVTRPRSMGGGEVGVETTFSEMCNELPGNESLEATAARSYCSMTGWCN